MTTHDDATELLQRLTEFRRTLEPAFGPDTAVSGSAPSPPSTGHCAVVAALTYLREGGELVSTRVEGESHWFNRFPGGVRAGGDLDVDLTADQFGGPPVRSGPSGTLYAQTRTRGWAELNAETLQRAERLAARAGLDDLSTKLRSGLFDRPES
ncbi:YunG family protein [Longimicrobium sp.]|uniref:YunG family protein n=1 Tax=Longimicrobium sp. TaxID=2029185 RepID=UPI003B3B5BAA